MANPDDDAPATFASPPCFLHEVDPAYSGLPPLDEQQQTDVARWRKAERKRLTDIRRSIDKRTRAAFEAKMQDTLEELLRAARGGIVGWYWPIRGEPDLRPLMARAAKTGIDCALPVVVKTASPLEFRRWTPGASMERGVWGIPVPSDGEVLAPDVVLAPVVGFDRCCFRLGNGGGYFDRTLASADPRPRTIGVGFSQTEVPTIYPQWHDIAMSCVVTEVGVRTPERSDLD